MHGARAGLIAGLALGVIEIAASSVLHADPWLPFDFAAAILVGPDALAPTFPLAAPLTLGMVIHVLLSLGFWGGVRRRPRADLSAHCKASCNR